jgi:hypothetical protein
MDESMVIAVAAVSVTLVVICLSLLNRSSEVHELGIDVGEVTKAPGKQEISPHKFRVVSGH